MSSQALTSTLRQARASRRLSQLELSLRMGISQRHVSYVENGRARPSRELLRSWLQVLEVPLALRNAAMLQAGYAPLYSAAPLDDPLLAAPADALTELLDASDPMPALVLDAHWNVLQANRGARWLVATLLPWVNELPGGQPLNLLDAFCHPEGLTRHLLNLDEVGPVMLAQLRIEAQSHPGLRAGVAALETLLQGVPGTPSRSQGGATLATPTLISRYASPFGELAFFSLFTTFGTPQSITLASLRVEHLFAANLATREILGREVR